MSQVFDLMAGATGLEPATSGVTGRRSNQLSYAPRKSVVRSEWERSNTTRPARKSRWAAFFGGAYRRTAIKLGLFLNFAWPKHTRIVYVTRCSAFSQ
jgi:hypothetical protein